MKSFRKLETALDTGNPGNDRSQKKDHRFVVDNSNSITPLDWFNARIGIFFKVQTMDNANIAANDLNGIHKFVKDIDVRLNNKKVYDCNDANHSVNIKICWNIVLVILKARQEVEVNSFFKTPVLMLMLNEGSSSQ